MRRMRSNTFFALFALCLLTSNVTVDAGIPVSQSVNLQDEVPKAVKDFLSTPVGKHYTLDQVMKAYNNGRAIMKAEANNVVSDVKVDEDFSLWTKGSEDAPDSEEIVNSDELTKQPGWSVYRTYQAGGKAYQSFDEVGEDGPGYLITPTLDLTAGEGIFKVTFRVKNVNPTVQDQVLQYFILNDDPSDANKGMISASSLPMTTEWKDLELYFNGGLPYTSIMFFGWQGKILVDNVKVEQLTYPLSIPKNVKFSATGGGEVTATWDAVDGATEYYVELVDREPEWRTSTWEEEIVSTTTVSGTSAALHGYLNPDHKYAVRVTAKNGDDSSYPGTGYGTLSVFEVAAPVATEATGITTTGFTANWETSQYAATYELSLVRTHTATADGEELVMLDEDFDDIPYSANSPKGAVQTTDLVTPGSTDKLFHTPGWGTMVGIGYEGYFGITNMYDAQGIPGVLVGPVSDFSIGGGKARISGTALSMKDDAQLKVGFGKLEKGKVVFNAGAQVFETSPSGTPFDVEVSGGSADSRLIFQIIDATEGGDMVMFDNIKATSSLNKGETFTLPYKKVNLLYDATSYTVDVPFTGNDKFEYSLIGSFGYMTSLESNVITVYSPEADGIEGVTADGSQQLEYTTLDGVRVASPSTSGIYIVSDGKKVYKIVK